MKVSSLRSQAEIHAELARVRCLMAECGDECRDKLYSAQVALAWALGADILSPSEMWSLVETVAKEYCEGVS